MSATKRKEQSISTSDVQDCAALIEEPTAAKKTPSKEAFERASAAARLCVDDLCNADGKLKEARHRHELLYASEVNKLENEGKDVLDRFNSLEERKVKAVESYDNDDVSDDDIVEINAGGKLIDVKRSILTQQKGTRLEALFSGRWEKKLQRDSSGRIFLDVDGDCFQAIVVYLSEYASLTDDDISALDPPCVYEEQSSILYDLMNLFQVNMQRMPPDSGIITKMSDANTLYDWLGEDGSDGEWERLYRRTTETLSNKSFHEYCDNQGPTIMIIETVEGGILGGYTNTSWRSLNAVVEYDVEYTPTVGAKANKAFLFVLDGFDLDSPIKMKLIDPEDKYAIHVARRLDDGPEFGGGLDLLVDGKHVQVETGHSYERPKIGNIGNIESQEYSIKSMEVFSIKRTAIKDDAMKDSSKKARHTIKKFSKGINIALNKKWETLDALNEEVTQLENSFKDEEHFIESFATGPAKDVIALNVSGTMIYTKRDTLMIIRESVLAQQFDDTKWTVPGTFPPVKAWTANEVVEWVTKIEGIPDDCASLFENKEINGTELLALDKDGLKMLGVERVGTICLLSAEIRLLKKAAKEDKVTRIEHHPYGFGKMLEYLRLKQLHSVNLAEDPAPVQIQESQMNSFAKVVDYYFPGELSELIEFEF